MHDLIKYIKQNPQALYITCVLLFIPAYFINLGLMPLLADEPIRAVVALEMVLSGNYWVPTINGEFYYRKPPVFNWVIAALFQFTGKYNEWMVRLPSVIPLFFYGVTIYWWVKQYISKKAAFLSAVMFITCGRMIIYASMLGHIDILYSWITFISFIAMWEFFKREKWLALFVISYFLAAAGFLMKGLPSVLFQGLSLLALFIYKNKWKKQFTWQHMLGVIIFLALVGGYFYKYSQFNNLNGWVEQLWDQSAQRTVIDKKWYHSLVHLFTFPFDNMVHLLPWSLLVVFCFKRGFWKTLMQNDFLKFITIIFLVNIPVYWLSPGYYPRYLFMLYPIVFIVIATAYFRNKEKLPKVKAFVEFTFLAAGALGAILLWAVPFVEVEFSFVYLKVIVLFTAMTFTLWLYYQLPQYRFLTFTIVLLLFRIGFNFFVLEHREITGVNTTFKNGAIRIAEQTKGADIYLHQGTPINSDATFYIETQRMEILKHQPDLKNAYFISREKEFRAGHCTYVDEFTIEWQRLTLFLHYCQED